MRSRVDLVGDDTPTDANARRRRSRTWALMDYDKPHRCPSWSGAGWKDQPEGTFPPCDGGSVPVWPMRDNHRFTWQFRTVTCPKCGVMVLQHALVVLTGHWWRTIFPRKSVRFPTSLVWRLRNSGR